MTKQESEIISEDQREKMLKRIVGRAWYTGWRPFCFKCTTNLRMEKRQYGFLCPNCSNKLGWDMEPLK